MKSWIVHYKNKYPGGLVLHDENSINVFCNRGIHRVAIRKNGHGQLVCVSEEHGLKDAHSLDPIPKNARVWKLYANGKIAPSEEAKERLEVAKKIMVDGRIPSIAELKKLGAGFDMQNNLLGAQPEVKPRALSEVMKDANAQAPKDAINVTSKVASALNNDDAAAGGGAAGAAGGTMPNFG